MKFEILLVVNIRIIIFQVVVLFSPVVGLARHVSTFNKRVLSPSTRHCSVIIWEIIILMTS